MKRKGVGGADGWISAEIKAVSPFFDHLAEFYNVMEISGVMPSESLVGDVSWIPKSSGSISYKDMLPITSLGLILTIYVAVPCLLGKSSRFATRLAWVVE